MIVSPGDEVIVPEPAWVNYAPMVRYPGGGVRYAACRLEDGFRMRISALEEAVTPLDQGAIADQPQHPTGAYLEKADLEQIAAFAIRHDLLVVSDEIYTALLYDGREPFSIAQLPGMRERTMVVNGFSKAFSMTGWRVGYAMGPAQLIRRMVLLQENVCSCVPAAAQMARVVRAFPAGYRAGGGLAFEQRRNLIYGGLRETPGIRCVKPQGAFYVFPDISELCADATAFCYELLDSEAVACVPGDAFGEYGQGPYPHQLRKFHAKPVRRASKRIGRFARRYC